MSRTACLSIALASLLTGAACTEFEPRTPEIAQSEDGNFEIIVSNQSFDVGSVDIEVFIDGKLAISDEFEVGSQHTFVPHTFKVPPGSHELVAVTEAGGAEITVGFQSDSDKRWGVLMYWFYPTETGGAPATPQQFTFDEHDARPLFD